MLLCGGRCPVLWDVTDSSVVRSAFSGLPGADDDREGEVNTHEDHSDDDSS